MKKLGAVLIVIGVVAACYLVLMTVMGTVTDLAETANATITASSNLTNYPGASEGLIAAPWVLWWVPGTIGMILIVMILRSK